MPILSRESPFSYTCGRCSHCCYRRKVYLNPFEIACVAEKFGITTTVCIEKYLNYNDFSLRHREDGACVFLEAGSCSVHSARPLPCRLYPLARRRTEAGEVEFAEITPEPDTAGIYGTAGTVGNYLKAQQSELFEEMADLYFKVFAELWQTLHPEPTTAEVIRASFSAPVPVQQRLLKGSQFIRPLLDIDLSIERLAASLTLPELLTAEARARFHIAQFSSLLPDKL